MDDSSLRAPRWFFWLLMVAGTVLVYVGLVRLIIMPWLWPLSLLELLIAFNSFLGAFRVARYPLVVIHGDTIEVLFSIFWHVQPVIKIQACDLEKVLVTKWRGPWLVGRNGRLIQMHLELASRSDRDKMMHAISDIVGRFHQGGRLG